eukprot:3255338-Pyramimonas_sp.AAC.1
MMLVLWLSPPCGSGRGTAACFVPSPLPPTAPGGKRERFGPLRTGPPRLERPEPRWTCKRPTTLSPTSSRRLRPWCASWCRPGVLL